MKERKREKEEERKQDRTCALGRELKMRRRSCIWGSTFAREEVSQDRKGSSRGSEEKAAASLS